MRGRLRILIAPLMLLLALGIRLAVIFIAFRTLQSHAGDTAYYVGLSRELHRLGLCPPSQEAAGMSTGPLYPVFLAPFFNWIPDRLTQIMAARTAQAVVDVATVYFLHRIAKVLFGERTSHIVLILQALDPRYILQAALITTETLYIALFAGFMWAYLAAIKQEAPRRYFGAGLLLGLATLTRPIPLLFPVVLAFHAGVIRRKYPRSWAGFWSLMLGMTLLAGTWIARNIYVSGGEVIPITDTAANHLWMSSREEGGDLGGEAYERAREEDLEMTSDHAYTGSSYLTGATQNILSNPFDWLGRMGIDVVEALLQPYGTSVLIPPGGPGLRALTLDALRGETPFSVVWQTQGFWHRLIIYIFHYVTLIGGIIGIILSCRQWRETLPIMGWIIYSVAVVAPLLIEPRYVFPVMPYLMILAASSMANERPILEET